MRSPLTVRKSNPCSPQLEEAHVQQQRPNAAKNKKINKFILKKRIKDKEDIKKKKEFDSECFWGK